MLLTPGTRLGPYEILSPIGAGGMGEVYRAHDTRLGRDVALKILPPEVAGDSSRRARFEQEARAVAALNHPNIVAVYDVGDGYMVSELVDGETLRGTKFGLRKTLDIAAQIAGGLAAAHAAGIVHRDLKPDNVMVRRGSTRDEAVLIDFGIALLDGQPDTLKFYGTAGYMAPEQARGEKVDGRADIYSLGKMIAQVWGSDEPPAPGFKPLAVFRRGEGQSAMPEPLAGVVRQMLASDREGRPELGVVRAALDGCQASKA